MLSGGTGYIGRSLTALLLERGHNVGVIARASSLHKAAPGAAVTVGNVLDADSVAAALAGYDTLVHLTGTPHPAPWKERAFRSVDLPSLTASAQAAAACGTGHFVYVSVAQPAPVMQAYLRVRQECEALLEEKNLRRTILRPWYVLGPGHRWPLFLQPVYKLMEQIPATRESAHRLGLVHLHQMTQALAWAVEHPPEYVRVLDVAGIRTASAEL
jgi:uncharacterized protein YbjT (DUF2867 family)